MSRRAKWLLLPLVLATAGALGWAFVASVAALGAESSTGG